VFAFKPAIASSRTVAASALQFCGPHFWRGFYELVVSEALERIAGFYAVEKDVRRRSPEERRAVRS
jgi:transposase